MAVLERRRHDTSKWRNRPALLVLLTILALPGSAWADGTSCPKTVKISFWGTVSAPSDRTVSIALANAVATATGVGCSVGCGCGPNVNVATTRPTATLKIDKTYQLTAGTQICRTYVGFEVPQGYALYIDGVEGTSIRKDNACVGGSGDGTWSIVVRRKCDCNKKEAGESPGPDLGSVVWSVGLGYLTDGRPAENVSIGEDMLTAAIYTPAALVYSPPGLTSEVDVVKTAGEVLRQIKAPQALADIVDLSAWEYDIRFYRPADVGPKVGGLYTVSGLPFVTWKIKNPTPPAAERLQISKILGATTDTSEYAWNGATTTWTLTTGAGRRIATRTNVVVAGDRVERTTIKDDRDQIASEVTRTYHTFPWGEELIREVVDPDGSALTTVYTYYQNAVQPHRYSKLESIARPDGSWEKYDFEPRWGFRSWVMRPWRDLTLPAATEWNSDMTLYYFLTHDGFATFPMAFLPFEAYRRIPNLGYRTRDLERISTVVNGQPAVWEYVTLFVPGPTQSVTTTRYYRTAMPFLVNRVAAVNYPDGRKDSYTYEKGDYITNADPALHQFVPNAAGMAQRETVTHGRGGSPDGVAFKTTKETIVRNEYGNVTLRESYVYTGAGYERIAWTVHGYTDRGQLRRMDRHTGQVSTATWDGDRKISEVDESGMETVYTYDSLGRVETSRKKGVAAGGGIPAQPDIVTTYTYDAEGRKLTETVTADTLSVTRSWVYDKAGRLQSHTDQAGLLTSYGYANGGRTVTVTRPGGATEITDRYLDGRTKSITGTAVVSRYSDYGLAADLAVNTQYTQEYVGAGGLASPRWTKTTLDRLDRATLVEQRSFTGPGLNRTLTYNDAGQLRKETLQTGINKLLADKFYEYDNLGNQVRAGLDIDTNLMLIANSTDRYVSTDLVYEKTGGDWFKVATTRTYLTDNSATSTTLDTQRERLTGFPASGSERTVAEITDIDTGGNATVTTTIVDRAAKKVIQRARKPDSTTDAVSISVNGLLQSSSPTTPQSATTYAYDALGRLTGVTEPRTGTTTRTYDPATGQLTSISDGVQTTNYEYYPPADPNAGRLRSQTNTSGKKVYFNYNPRGELIQTWGDTSYPVEYVFDGYGQRTEMHTFRGGSGWQASTWPAATTGPADVTRWNYHEPTGLLASKQDAVGRQVSYTYDTLSRLRTRTWARPGPLTTSYSYDNNTGELTTVEYSDSTPRVTIVYDRGGRAINVTDVAGTHVRAFTPDGQLQADQISSGILDGVTVTVGYDTFLRRNALSASRNSVTLTSQSYGYDPTGRLQTVTSAPQTVTYTYHPTRGLLTGTAYTGGTNITKDYDPTGRLQSITTTPSAGGPASYTYTYNGLNQRTRATREDGSYWAYGYNDRGEVTSGKNYWSDATPAAGQQFEYDFDNIGNRNTTKAGGDQAGSNLRLASYTPNNLNQYTQRSVPGAVDVFGTAHSAATVTVNGQAPYRRGEYFRQELSRDNTGAPVYTQASVVGSRDATVTQRSGYVYLPRTPEAYTYDLDGNLTSDGQWSYTWDAENRLIRMESIASVPPEAKQKLEFAYDFQGRRIEKKVSVWRAALSSYVLQSTTRFVYDGWNLVAELNGAGTAIRSYVWGQDVSGTLDGAGGIGGLLLVRESANTYQVGYDGNGNVTTLVKASTGTVAASYDYDPFGNILKSTGDAASRNPFTSSGKYTDSETGFLYYGLRFYNPSTGRWISRDPLEEAGGTNLNSFVANNPVIRIDFLGLRQVQIWASAYIPDTTFIYPYPPAFDPLALWYGDGRTAPQVSGSARASHTVIVELDPALPPEVANASAGSVTRVDYSPLGIPPTPKTRTAYATHPAPSPATVSRSADGCATTVTILAELANGLVKGAPPLHYDYTITLNCCINHLAIRGSHGQYPAFDVVINGKAFVNDAPPVNDPLSLLLPRRQVGPITAPIP